MTRIIIMLMLSLSLTKQVKAEIRKDSRIVAISKATNQVFLESYYVAAPVKIGKMTGSGPVIEKEVGYLVLRGIILYDLIFKQELSLECFSNYLFAKCIKNEDILLNEAQYEKIKDYTISNDDAERFLKMLSSDVIKTHGKEGFLPTINEDTPNYIGRCVIFNLFNNGYVIQVEDDSGFLTYQKI